MATQDNASMPDPRERYMLRRPHTVHRRNAMPESGDTHFVGKLSQKVERLAFSRLDAISCRGGRSLLSLKPPTRHVTYVGRPGGVPDETDYRRPQHRRLRTIEGHEVRNSRLRGMTKDAS